MKSNLVISHAECADGFGAAFAAWLSLGETAEYVFCRHGDFPPDVQGRHVFVLDFSFSPEVLLEMSQKAASLTLLDHHVTAEKSLKHFKPVCCGRIHIDLSHCGAVLAWNHFHPNASVPKLLRMVEARDLWKWDDPDAPDFLAWLDLVPRTFEAWQAVLALNEEEFAAVLREGKAIRRKFDALCDDLTSRASPVSIDGVAGLMVNAPGEFASQVGDALADRCNTFGLVWFLDPRGLVKCSLRSRAPFEVEPIARRFGGGGHAQAAGFTLSAKALQDLVAGRLRTSS